MIGYASGHVKARNKISMVQRVRIVRACGHRPLSISWQQA
jgi:hypothetical protein